MSTPLFWQTCHMINNTYGKILRYSTPLQICPETQSFIFQKSFKKCGVFYACLLLGAIFVLQCFAIIVEILVIESITKPTFVVIFYFMEFGLSLFICLLIILILKNGNVCWNQFMNKFIWLEVKISHRNKNFSQILPSSGESFKNLFIKGIVYHRFAKSLVKYLF